MTLSDLRTLASVWLDDVGNGYFTVPQLNIWLNNAQKTVQKKLIRAKQNYYFKVCQTNTVIGQQDYVMPEDFKKLHRLEVVVSGTGTNEVRQRLQPITPNQTDFSNLGPACPDFYFDKRNRFSLWPVPDQVYVLRLSYTYEVTDMVLDTDIPDVPESYQEFIACIAAMDGFIRDGRSSQLLAAKIALYEEMLLSDSQERNEDEPRSITVTDMSGYGGYIF